MPAEGAAGTPSAGQGTPVCPRGCAEEPGARHSGPPRAYTPWLLGAQGGQCLRAPLPSVGCCPSFWPMGPVPFPPPDWATAVCSAWGCAGMSWPQFPLQKSTCPGREAVPPAAEALLVTPCEGQPPGNLACHEQLSTLPTHPHPPGMTPGTPAFSCFQLQSPESFAKSVQELTIVLQRTGDPANLNRLRPHLELLANIDPNPGMPRVCRLLQVPEGLGEASFGFSWAGP